MTDPLRIVSYGGGVQSTALLVLAAQRRIGFRTFVMANVGNDSENPATMRYLESHAGPYAERHGIALHLVDRVKRNGEVETLYGRLLNPIRCSKCSGSGKYGVRDDALPADDPDNWLPPGEERVCPKCEGVGTTESRSLPIPVRMSNGAPGSRSCTSDFKIRVIGKWLKAHGASMKNPATVGIGISLDEIHRANSRHVEPYEKVVYPLVGIGEDTGLHMRRSDCMQVIRDAGLPVPPKSSCYFCPFHRPAVWEDMARNEPELFEKAAALEDTLNVRRRMLGKDEVFLTRFAKPLREAIDQNKPSMFEWDDTPDDDGNCDSGWCMT